MTKPRSKQDDPVVEVADTDPAKAPKGVKDDPPEVERPDWKVPPSVVGDDPADYPPDHEAWNRRPSSLLPSEEMARSEAEVRESNRRRKADHDRAVEDSVEST